MTLFTCRYSWVRLRSKPYGWSCFCHFFENHARNHWPSTESTAATYFLQNFSISFTLIDIAQRLNTNNVFLIHGSACILPFAPISSALAVALLTCAFHLPHTSPQRERSDPFRFDSTRIIHRRDLPSLRKEKNFFSISANHACTLDLVCMTETTMKIDKNRTFLTHFSHYSFYCTR